MRHILSYILLALCATMPYAHGSDYAESLRQRTGISSYAHFREMVPLIELFREPSCTRRNTVLVEVSALVSGYAQCIYTDSISDFFRVVASDYDLLMALSYTDLRVASIESNTNEDDTYYVIYRPEYAYRALFFLVHRFHGLVNTPDIHLYRKAHLLITAIGFVCPFSEATPVAQCIDFMQRTGHDPEVNHETQQAFVRFVERTWPRYGPRQCEDAKRLIIDQASVYFPQEELLKQISQVLQDRNASMRHDIPMNTIIDHCVDPHQKRFDIEREGILRYIECIGQQDDHTDMLA